MSRDWNIVDETAAAAPEAEPSGLDERRIHAVTTERRAANRARVARQLIVPTAVAIAIAAAVRAARAWPTSPWFAAACTLVALVAGVIAIRTRRRKPIELPSHEDEPTTTPDFGPLGGGAGDAARRLEALDDTRA